MLFANIIASTAHNNRILQYFQPSALMRQCQNRENFTFLNFIFFKFCRQSRGWLEQKWLQGIAQVCYMIMSRLIHTAISLGRPSCRGKLQ